MLTQTSIYFQGIHGQILETSNHGNYCLVRLSDRITVCGTYSNIWEWEENLDESSGFISFITYIGFKNKEEFTRFELNLGKWLDQRGATIDQQKNGNLLRKSKRTAYPLEIKIRDIPAADIPELLQFF